MNITCPNCQKKYHLDETKLPPGINDAKCKACGRLMPLKQAPHKASANPTDPLKVVCRHCGQGYRLRPDKIPPGVKTITCKSCDRLVPLSRAGVTAPDQPLKNDSSAPAAAEATQPPVPKIAIVGFRCAGCGKIYKIDHHELPPTAGAVKCTACGHNIQLPPEKSAKTDEDPTQPDAPHQKQPLPKPDRVAEETPRHPVRPRKKKWRYAVAACILLIGILAAVIQFNIVKIDELRRHLPGSTKKTAGSSQSLDSQPFLVLNLNVPLILDALENRLKPDKKTARFQMMMSAIKSMELDKLELYLYAGPKGRVLPVVLAQGSNRQQLENMVNRHQWFKKYFTRGSNGTYRLKEDVLNAAENYRLPREPYQLTVIDTGAVLAPVSFSAVITENPQTLSNSRVAAFAKKLETRQGLATMAIRVPENMSQGWEKKIQDHPAVQTNPQTAMIAGMTAAIISQVSGSLNSVDFLALGFGFSGRHGRVLSYAQQFRPGVDGEKIHRQLAAADPADSEISAIIRNLVKLFQDQRYRHTLDFENNRLALEFSWSQKEDEAFLTALTAATIGQLVAGSMDLRPTPGQVNTRYTSEPTFVTTVDTDRLKTEIAQSIKDSLFPSQYWSRPDNPQMTLTLDTMDLPNAALAEMTYRVKSIRSAGGRNLLRADENKNTPRIQPGSLYPGNIALNVKAGTPADDLANASIQFDLTVPAALDVLEFAATDQPGRVKEAAGNRVTLARLEKDVAQVSSSTAKSMRLIAYDHTGKALASRESIATSSSISTRFEGMIHTLKVVIFRKIFKSTFEVEVDLNQGKALVLAREPEIPVRKRYNPHPIPTYVNFSADDLQNLPVVWTEGKEGSWHDSLSIKLPQGPFSGHALWEVHFFGHNKPLPLTGNFSRSSTDFSFTLDKGKLKQANAAFGKVQISLHTDISRLVFAPRNGDQPAAQILPSGDAVSVEFNKNEITYRAGHADVIQTIAYDTRGKRLKQDPYTRNKGGSRVIYFWGVPARFEMDVTAKAIEKLILFDIRQRPLEEATYRAFKLTINNQREVVRTIKAIDRARRKDRSFYGDDLAGLHYLYHGKQNRPMNLISQQIAHSDPAGQTRFGYPLTPYKGYYFTVLSGVESNGTKKDYNRRSRPTRFSWQKGTVDTTSLTRHPDLVAIPQDQSQPTFFLQWGQVFMKSLNGEKLEYLPDGYYNKGWVEARYIEG